MGISVPLDLFFFKKFKKIMINTRGTEICSKVSEISKNP